LRIEDIDSPRIKPGALEQTFEDLTFLGLDWDGPAVIQSTRIPLHAQALERLRQLNLVYPCTCTRKDIEGAASAPHLDHEGPLYPGTCAHRRPEDSEALIASGQPFCWRYRVPEEEQSPVFDDGLRGRCVIDLRKVGGDFVVWKSGRTGGHADTPAYQLSVVVDDADQGVTEVVRGDDLITSTPRQLLLYEALGLSPPTFIHVPLVVGPDGRRLAKRHGDTRLSALREAGVSPGQLRGLLAWSLGWIDRITEQSIPDLIHLFRLDTIPARPFVLAPELLGAIGYEP
jgi:glutamyl-tRNA synthetase